MKKHLLSGCIKFTSKSMQVPNLADNMDEYELDLIDQYTCLKTGNVVGPDNDVVSPESCKAHRRCFENF